LAIAARYDVHAKKYHRSQEGGLLLTSHHTFCVRDLCNADRRKRWANAAALWPHWCIAEMHYVFDPSISSKSR